MLKKRTMQRPFFFTRKMVILSLKQKRKLNTDVLLAYFISFWVVKKPWLLPFSKHFMINEMGAYVSERNQTFFAFERESLGMSNDMRKLLVRLMKNTRFFSKNPV